MSRDFRREFLEKANFQPTRVQSPPMITRWIHEYHTIIPEALTNHIRSGSFAYDVDENGTRRLHEGFTIYSQHRLGVKFIPESIPKA